MNKFLLTFLLVALTETVAWAQPEPGTIQGRIIDTNNQPLPSLTVVLEGSNLGDISDIDGEFVINNVPANTYQLVVSGVGYQTRRRTVTVAPGQTLQLDIRVRESLTQLQEVEIIGRQETTYQNDVSFIGSKTATPLMEVPQSVSYVTKELALDQAAFRVNDVVKNMSGVNQFSFYNDITIRGFRVAGQRNSGNLVNGMRAFTSFWKQQLIPQIERVEVIKGPASALFGNASPGGTINRVTKKPLREQRQSISATVGSFNTLRTLADFTGPMTSDERLLYRLNVGYENSGSFRDLQYDKNLIVAPSFSFLPSERTSVNVDVVYQGSEGRLDRGQAVFGDGDLYSVPITVALNASNDYLNEESINATLSFRHQFSPRLSFNSVYLRSSYDEDLLEHRTANTFATLGDGTRDPERVEMRVFIRKRSWNNDNFNNYLNLDLETGPLQHQLLLGYDYFQQVLEPGGSQLQARGYLSADRSSATNRFDPENAADFALDDDGNPVPNVPHFDLTDPNANRLRDMSNYIYTTRLFEQSLLNSHGIYVQDQITWGKLKLLLGLRQEFFQDALDYRTSEEETVSQNALLPRLGAVYSVSPSVNLYATYVEGYQPQTASVINDPNAGGPFDPLISSLIEGGAKSSWFNDQLSMSLAVYRLVQKNELFNANDPANPDRLAPLGEQVAQGVEFDVVGQLLPNWSVVANYAFNDATITASDDEAEVGRQVPNAPRHAGNLWTKYVIDRGSLAGIGFGLGMNFVSERFGSIVRTDEPPVFPGYQVIDAAVYYQLEKFRIQVNVNNVLDQTHWVGGYDYIRAFPGAPRNLLTTVSYTF